MSKLVTCTDGTKLFLCVEIIKDSKKIQEDLYVLVNLMADDIQVG